jgi:signal peptidase II
MRRNSYILLAAGIGTLLFFSDELLKQLVRTRLAVCDVARLSACASMDLVGPLRLMRAENAGSALGLHQGWAIWLVLAALGLGLIPLYTRQLRAFGVLAAVATGLQAGGALGNLLDRVVFGSATDMLTIGHFLVWNVADLGLALGTLLATALLLVRVATDRPPDSGLSAVRNQRFC